MKNTQKNIWQNLSSSQKLNLIGSGLLIISLFLNWYSDKDVFRSGDIYTGLSGPLYFVGITIFGLALANIIGVLALSVRLNLFKNLNEINLGKWQMYTGFVSMYLMMVVNSVYFHPQFGLNILSKKSDIGVMVALVATVMICIGGYLGFRHKFENAELKAEEGEKIIQVKESPIKPEVTGRPHVSGIQKMETLAETAPAIMPKEIINQPEYFSERDSRGKTEFERAKLYENLRKTMMRDTMSPQERKKARQQEVNQNAFSANFGKEKKVAAQADQTGKSEAKKPQMYRMDL